jgi:flagellar hook-associated protein 3 FlgL
MRITQQMPSELILRNLNSTVVNILQDQDEIATGNLLTSPASNPAALAQDLLTTSQLAQTSQWSSVASSALSVAQATDTTLGQIVEAAQSAYSLGVSANSPMNSEQASTIATQIESAMTSIGQLANTQVGDIYVLGGESGTAPWSSAMPTVVTGAAPMAVQVGPGTEVQQNVDGSSTVGGLLAALQGLALAVGTGQGTAGWETSMNTALGDLRTAMDSLEAQRAQFDAGVQSLTAAQSELQANETSLTEQQAALQSANIPQVVSDLASQETSYQAILQTTSQVLLPSLANYLK